MARSRGIRKSTIVKAQRDERRAAKIAKATGAADSFQNWGLNLGQGTNNALSGSTYGFNPITRVRTLLEWIHRGSWIGGAAVDYVASDMVREGINLESSGMDPKDAEELQRAFTDLGIWHSIECVLKWGRLYGGAIGVFLIDGQDPRTPLRLETVAKDQFRGIGVLDRWMIEPDLTNLVQTLGPDCGLPEYYRVNLDAPTMRGKVIHYTRVFRSIGVELPYWQSVMENLWGISVIERMYDRMIAFDSATQGAAQAVYKCYLRYLKIKGFRQLTTTGGPAARGLAAYMEMMRTFQGIEGMVAIDSEDDFQVATPQVSGGIAEALVQFGQQIAGALEMPLTRLFGQSPQGMSATGEHDEVMYYDGIKKKQETMLRVPVLKTCRMVAQSRGLNLDKGFNFTFAPLWQLSEDAQSQIGDRDTASVLAVESAGILPQKAILEELRDRGKRTGRWNSITDKIIKEADEEMPPRADAGVAPGEGPEDGGGGPGGDGSDRPSVPKKKSKDSLPKSEIDGVQVVVEFRKGESRWTGARPLLADYGYVRRVSSSEGATEWMDCFVGDDGNVGRAYVCDMVNRADDTFDEHKIVFGVRDPNEAARVLIDQYAGLGTRPGALHTLTIPALLDWFERGGDFSVPYGEYARPRLVSDNDEQSRAQNGEFGPSNEEKIRNAATMYGTGSKQHKEAQRRFGGQKS